ncbi:coiled-coil domain-containing protein 142 isoform X6 [Calonectris borealis]|uniref:coiled-coil domain-containing protein 142 isoform X6 n=1 Tax=Calonectris borealis TaxID=1323832 RepID=UPI003F4C53E4
MEDGGPERRGGEPCPQVGEGDGAGLSGLILLLLTARPALPAPGYGAARGEPAEPGSSSLGGLARSLQKAEAMLRNCVSPGLRRLLPPRPRERGYDSEDRDEDEEAPALLAALEQSFPGLHRCLCVWEDPRTETFRGHVRPQPGDSAAAFSYHPVHPRVAERGAALHALLQHRHYLRLARDYSRRLKASSDFVRRLLALVEQPEPPAGELEAAQPLQGLCRELRTHAGHWSGLRRRMHGDPWLRPLLLCRHEPVAHMRWALLLLALHATRLAEHHAEARLRGLARTGPAVTPAPALLSDLFQGLEIYNQVVGDLTLELGIAGCHRATGDHSHAFPVARVLGILAAERGRLAADRLQPLLQPRDGAVGAEHVCWEDAVVPWPLEHGTTVADAGPSEREDLPGLAGELQALCREDEELMGLVLGGLVASADSLWHHVLCGPKQEKPVPVAESPEPLEPLAASPGTATGPSSPSWKSVRWLDDSRAPAAEALHAQYRPLFWEATSAALGHRLGLPRCGAGRAAAAARELSHALAQARVPRECEEELGQLCLRLLCRDVLQSWERAAEDGDRQAGGAGERDLPGARGQPPAAAPRPAIPPGAPAVPGDLLHGCQHPALLGGRAEDVLHQLQADVGGDLRPDHATGQALEGRPPRGWVGVPRCRAGPRAGPRAGLRVCVCVLPADLPSSPSAYAAAAAQAVLGQVLQGAQLLPRDAQAPALARVTTAFLEAWMDHILAQRIKFSLQGALQLRQDFELVRELVGSERYGLAPETRQSLLSLRIFQQMDGAILCLLQQPGGAAGVPPRPWHSLRHCCSDNGAHAQEPGTGSLHGLETLEAPAAAAGTPPSAPGAEVPTRLRSGVPESYLSGSQQQWLSLRLHRARRWRVPGLPCIGNNPEA